MTMETIELHLRAFMMKLISLDGALGDIENVEDLTWALVLDMKDDMTPQSEDKGGNEPSQGSWVPFNDQQVSSTTARTSSKTSPALAAIPAEKVVTEADEDDGPLILPVKSLDTGVINMMLYVEEHPKAKRASQDVRTPSKGKGRSQRRSQQTTELDESIQAGERDIDAPLPQSTSSGAAVSFKRKKQRRKGNDDQNEGVSSGQESLDSSGDDSIKSVNDFAGYGKGAGSVGMSGVGM
jgi:mitotic spindle assembly checkpoint protein MAD2B